MKCIECEVDWEEVFEELEKMKKKKQLEETERFNNSENQI